jgi:MarR family 2-MHQ and catechol resistance regulon transcriptional repressor
MKTTQKYGKKADLALSLWVKLARANSVVSRQTKIDIERYGLTAPQFAVLEALGHLGPMNMGTLCSKLLVTGGNVTVVIDNLEKADLVMRKQDTEDRRTVTVQLTSKGKEKFENIFPKHARFIADAMRMLTKDEQIEAARLLKKLGLALQSKSQPHDPVRDRTKKEERSRDRIQKNTKTDN